MRSHFGTFLELAMWTLELRKLLHFLDFYCQSFYGRAITLLDFHSAMLPLVSAGYVALYPKWEISCKILFIARLS